MTIKGVARLQTFSAWKANLQQGTQSGCLGVMTVLVCYLMTLPVAKILALVIKLWAVAVQGLKSLFAHTCLLRLHFVVLFVGN